MLGLSVGKACCSPEPRAPRPQRVALDSRERTLPSAPAPPERTLWMPPRPAQEQAAALWRSARAWVPADRPAMARARVWEPQRPPREPTPTSTLALAPAALERTLVWAFRRP